MGRSYPESHSLCVAHSSDTDTDADMLSVRPRVPCPSRRPPHVAAVPLAQQLGAHPPVNGPLEEGLSQEPSAHLPTQWSS